MSSLLVGGTKTAFMEREVNSLGDIFGPLGWCPIRRRIAESSGWIRRGEIRDKKLKANLNTNVHLYVAPVPLLGIRIGGGPLKRKGVYNIPDPGLQADLTLKKILIEDQCNPHVYYKFAWKKRPKKPNRLPHLECPGCENSYMYYDRVHDERICGYCGLTDVFDFRLWHRGWSCFDTIRSSHAPPNNLLCDFCRKGFDKADIGPIIAPEVTGDDHAERNWSVEEPDPGGENFDFGQITPQMDGTFLGESSLSQIEMGSPAITRDKLTIHYCSAQTRKIDGRIIKTGYIARSVWWSNPKNPANRRWYCLKCVKANSDKTYFPTHWYLDDIALIKSLGKIARKGFQPDYRLEIHYQERKKNRLDIHIKNYIKKRNLIFQSIGKDQKSYFHDEPVRDNEYLRD